MNVLDPSALRACTSCGVCGAVCPTSAITLQLNADGFYRPLIDSQKCIDCSLCVKSCYKFDPDIKNLGLEGKTLYAASAKDGEVVKQTTSGGIADLLAKSLISQGYKCIGVTYNCSNNRAEGAIATTDEETNAFRGSKYIQSYSVDAFKQLVNECKTEKCAVFGLPCQIYGLSRFLEGRGVRDRHLLIDLYCHGCPSLNLWSKYIGETLKKVNGTKVLGTNFRSKVRGWGSFYVVVVVEGRPTPIKVVSPRINDPFFTLFFSDTVLNDSCPDCLVRSTLDYTDIRLGDFWGREYVSNNEGVSAVTICSEHGANAFAAIESQISYEPQDFDKFIPYQSYGRDYKVNESLRQVLLTQLADPEIPLHTTVKTFHSTQGLKGRVKHMLKNVVKLLPGKLISTIKSIFYSLK